MDFYCTAGRGTHQFVARELKQMFSENVKVQSTDGKTYFSVDDTKCDLHEKLISLKSVERLFVQCIHEQFDKTDRRGLLTLLHTKLNNADLWKTCLATLNNVNQNLSENSKNELDIDSEPARKKPKRDNRAVTFYQRNKFEDDLGPAMKKPKRFDGVVTFRVSCRMSGYPGRQLDNKKTSKQMGVLISKLLGWKIDLRRPQYEVSIHLSDDTLTVGIPVFDRPLSLRPYIKHCGLRTPIAWIMVQLLDLQPGEIVLDPMCGCSTILLEATHSYKTCTYIGIDKGTSQLKLSSENLSHIGACGSHISLIQGDARNQSLLDDSVHHVVADAPFDQNHKISGDIQQFYENVLIEMGRVVKAYGKIVILTSSSICEHLKTIIPSASDFRYHDYHSQLDGKIDCVQEIDCVAESVCEDSCNQSEKNEDANAAHYDREMECKADCAQENDCVHKSECKISWNQSNGNQLVKTAQSDTGRVSTVPMCHEKLSSLKLISVYCIKLGETEGCICVIQKQKEIKDIS